MAALNERNAIQFLRALLNWEPGVLEDGKHDPGWCCSEHALVATTAFLLCGHRALRCEGYLVIGDTSEKAALKIDPHSFTYVDGVGFFDSSATFGEIEGIPIAHAKRYNGLQVSGGKVSLTPEEIMERAKVRGSRYAACYHVEESYLPNRESLDHVRTTPIGEWLTARYGSQQGLWYKAAWKVAGILKNDPLPKKLDRDSLWAFVRNTRDVEDVVISKLSRFV